MKISKLLTYINQSLNYPSLSFNDIDLFLDQAISELNTTLHTSIPPISVMKDDFRQYLSKQTIGRRVLIPSSQDPAVSGTVIPGYTDAEIEALSPKPAYLYNETKNRFGIYHTDKSEYEYFKTIYGTFVRNGIPEVYVSYFYSDDPTWILYTANEEDCDLADYLPDDWCMLWLIPYVCFKYTVRDGGTAQTFADELTQGFQQLQETYDVPSTIVLSTVADKYAYKKLVEDNLDNLNIRVPVKAIYENMKHPRNMNAIFGSMYNRGGFL